MRSFFIACALVVSAPSFGADDISADIKDLARLFPGAYDNVLQVEAEKNMDVPANLRHARQTMVVAPIARPSKCCPDNFDRTDAHFFYFQTYRDGKLWLPGEEIFAIYHDPAEGAIRWHSMGIVDAAKWVGMDRDVEKQRNVELAPPGIDKDCRVLVRKAGPEDFRGQVKGGGCDVISGQTGKPRRLELEFSVTPAGLTYMERGLDNGVVAYGNPEGIPFLMQRIGR